MTTLYKPRASAYDPQTTADSGPSESLIDRHSHFNGVYHTSYDLRIEGSAEGEIECDGTVTVAPNAHVEAKVRARNVVLAGAASGEITCADQFTLRPTGQMRGQVRAASLSVEEGAFFEGEFQMADAPAPPAVTEKSAPTSAPNVAPPRGGKGNRSEANGSSAVAPDVAPSAATEPTLAMGEEPKEEAKEPTPGE